MLKKFRYLKVNTRIITRKFISFLYSKVELKTFIILASLVVGILSGLASALLKNSVKYLEEEPKVLFHNLRISFLLPFTPLIGILLSTLIIIVVFNGKLSKGISNVIFLISRKASYIPKVDIISHFITSGISVGLGGSAGLEAPIVVTGAAIGSNIASELKFNYKTRTLLLACGSGAGISAIFNSPIAGVIFAVEVLLPEFSIPAFIPLLIASASAAVVSRFLYSGQLFYLVTEGWKLSAIPFYVVLGILSGLVSFYIIKVTLLVEKYFEKMKRPYLKALIGGLVLCILVFLFPALYGEGYTSIMNLLSGHFEKFLPAFSFPKFIDNNLLLIIIAAFIIITKVFATTITISSGGNGGIIAPALFSGAFTGYFLAQSMSYMGIAHLNFSNFIVVGMAGVLSGILHAPLTGIFLIAEVTGGYTLIVPLMIVSAISFFISRYFNPHSIYTSPLSEKGITFRSEKEKYFIQQIKIREIIENDFIPLSPVMTLREIVDNIVHSKRNIFPVIDDKKNIVGIITLDNIREVMLDSDLYDVILAYEIMDRDFHSISINAEINEALEQFEANEVWNLAVVNDKQYCGFISKSNIFNKYLTSWGKQNNEGI